eukprot:Amastigsp_a175358_65.p2 type:complete len:118 gc:universal Amastigsp_a175358_65:355-2(-)
MWWSKKAKTKRATRTRGFRTTTALRTPNSRPCFATQASLISTCAGWLWTTVSRTLPSTAKPSAFQSRSSPTRAAESIRRALLPRRNSGAPPASQRRSQQSYRCRAPARDRADLQRGT